VSKEEFRLIDDGVSITLRKVTYDNFGNPVYTAEDEVSAESISRLTALILEAFRKPALESKDVLEC
jgi:hypothetical protein